MAEATQEELLAKSDYVYSQASPLVSYIENSKAT